MNVVEESYAGLFGSEQLGVSVKIKYSGKFKPYNANVRKVRNSLYFSLSRSWKGVSREIVLGLLQHLLLKILKRKIAKPTTNMLLYDDFIRSMSELVNSGTGTLNGDETLEAAFNRVNTKYFYGLIDKPLLIFEGNSSRRLASYDYVTNTIKVSSIFRNAPELVIDYLVYHELLHKKLKFRSNGSRSLHHTRQFKELEAQFEGREAVDKYINNILRRKRFVAWL